MKRFFTVIFPNLTISMLLCTMTVVIVGMRNPMMGFLDSTPFLILSLVTGFSAIGCCIGLYSLFREKRRAPAQKSAHLAPRDKAH